MAIYWVGTYWVGRWKSVLSVDVLGLGLTYGNFLRSCSQWW